jgi:hypothetical protein
MKQPDPLARMSPVIRAEFNRLPTRIQKAYIHFRLDRLERRGAHRDQLEAFVAGYYMRPGRTLKA